MVRLKGLISVSMMILISGCTPSYAKHYDVQFQDVACIKPHKGYHYMTCNPIGVTVDGDPLNIPKDFDTDLASIPRWLWTILAPSRSDFIAPSILHDYLYTCHNGYERQEIDEIFYDSLIDNGVSRIRAYEMYLAVRFFGESHFNEEGSCKERLATMTARYGRCTDKDVKIS